MRRALAPAIVGLAAGSSLPVALAATVIAPPVLPSSDAWLPTGGGQIRLLDKQKAESQLVTLAVGSTVRFETLAITLDACDAHAPTAPPNGAAHLTIVDGRSGEPGFNGWMLADEPWVSTLQSPVYGVRVVGCEAPSAQAIAAATPSPPPVPAAVPPAPGAAASTPPPAPPSDLEAPPGSDLGTDPDPNAPPPPPGNGSANPP